MFIQVCIFNVTYVYYSSSVVCFLNISIYNSDNVSTIFIVCIFVYLYRFMYEDLYQFCFLIYIIFYPNLCPIYFNVNFYIIRSQS